MSEKFIRTLCVDFDGVIHSYESGWKGALTVSDPPVRGAIAWLTDIVEEPGYDVAIYSSRSREPGAIEAMRKWLHKFGMRPDILDQIDFPTQKPATYLTIDDRAICFRGTFPSIMELDHFRAWNEGGGS